MKRLGRNRTNVLIVGAGPVGLDLACRLLLMGYSVRVLEERATPTEHSRSIGIHPPGLEALAEIGIADNLLTEGIAVRDGLARSDDDLIGILSFDRCPEPYPFVLAIPQWRTEQILETRLTELDPGCLVRGEAAAVIDAARDGGSVIAASGRRYEADWIVGCDGKASVVRKGMGIGFPGRSYRDTYVMGDFHDDTGFGPRAVVFLAHEGLVESFPLPRGRRRWVVRTAALVDHPDAERVGRLVTDRTTVDVNPSTATMTSAFGVQRYLADTMGIGRILLAGDAAHIVSPIGGQGMNLGWLDSRDAAAAIDAATTDPERGERIIKAYSRRRRRAAAKAARRSEFNMAFGRPTSRPRLKNAAARLLLTRLLAGFFARQFTMRGL